jgi:hypothetical protein
MEILCSSNERTDLSDHLISPKSKASFFSNTAYYKDGSSYFRVLKNKYKEDDHDKS